MGTNFIEILTTTVMLGDFRNNILDGISIKDEEEPSPLSQTFQSQAHGPSPGFRNLLKVFKKDGSTYGNREPSILCHQALARYLLLFTPLMKARCSNSTLAISQRDQKEIHWGTFIRSHLAQLFYRSVKKAQKIISQIIFTIQSKSQFIVQFSSSVYFSPSAHYHWPFTRTNFSLQIINWPERIANSLWIGERELASENWRRIDEELAKNWWKLARENWRKFIKHIQLDCCARIKSELVCTITFLFQFYNKQAPKSG